MVTKNQFDAGCELWFVSYDRSVRISDYNSDIRNLQTWNRIKSNSKRYFTTEAAAEYHALAERLTALNDD